MSRRLRKLAMIERRWREHFGEPPSLLTDPDLMRQILDAEQRKAAPRRPADADSARV